MGVAVSALEIAATGLPGAIAPAVRQRTSIATGGLGSVQLDLICKGSQILRVRQLRLAWPGARSGSSSPQGRPRHTGSRSESKDRFQIAVLQVLIDGPRHYLQQRRDLRVKLLQIDAGAQHCLEICETAGNGSFDAGRDIAGGEGTERYAACQISVRVDLLGIPLNGSPSGL